ncbi:hypothetical protein ACHAWF_000798, partial [Thalassiosira exigua]
MPPLPASVVSSPRHSSPLCACFSSPQSKPLAQRTKPHCSIDDAEVGEARRLLFRTMAVISSTLLDEADQLVTLLGRKCDSASTTTAVNLEARVASCMSEYWRNGERGNIVLRGILNEFRTQPPVQSISVETPSKSVVSSLASPPNTNGHPGSPAASTPLDIKATEYCSACSVDWGDDDASVDAKLLHLFEDSDYDSSDDSDYSSPIEVDSDIDLEADDTANEELDALSDAESEVTAQTEATTGTGSVAVANQPTERKRGRPS